jgi:hypothetical protein
VRGGERLRLASLDVVSGSVGGPWFAWFVAARLAGRSGSVSLDAHVMIGQEAMAFVCCGCKEVNSARVVSWERRNGGMSRVAGPLR